MKRLEQETLSNKTQIVSILNETERISKTCPGCLAKDAHINDLKLLLASERQNFHEFNKTVHQHTGIITSGVKNNEPDELDRPVRMGNMPFNELRAMAEAKSREIADSRTRESKQVEDHQRQAGAKYVGERNVGEQSPANSPKHVEEPVTQSER